MPTGFAPTRVIEHRINWAKKQTGLEVLLKAADNPCIQGQRTARMKVKEKPKEGILPAIWKDQRRKKKPLTRPKCNEHGKEIPTYRVWANR